MAGIKNKITIPYEEGHRTNNGILEKLCNKCFNWFPLNSDNFYKNNKSPDGFFPYCANCARKKTEQNQLARFDEYMEDQRRRSRLPHVKKNQKGYFQKYIQNHGEERKEYSKGYQLNHLEEFNGYNKKRKPKNHKITITEWENCKKYFIHRCAYCGIKIEDHWILFKGKTILGDFHKEHIDDDGSIFLDNCVPSCKSCNSAKWEFDFNEWYNKDNSRFSEERYNRIIKWTREDYKKFIKTREETAV